MNEGQLLVGDRPVTPPPPRKDYLAWENARNHAARDLYRDILHAAFGTAEEVVIGHHLTFDGDEPDEIPSADTMIFDHDIARRLWGADYQHQLMLLVCEPCDTRDALLARLFYGRQV